MRLKKRSLMIISSGCGRCVHRAALALRALTARFFTGAFNAVGDRRKGVARSETGHSVLLLLVGVLLLAACTAVSEQPTVTPEPVVQNTAVVEATAVPTDAPTVVAEATVAETAVPEVAEPPTAEPAAIGAADADVQFVSATETSPGVWTFAVTVAHPDTGWEDYADGWDVVLADGTVLKPDPDSPFTRLLLHPHETEQPFTRSQSNIEIPAGETAVTVRAHDIVDGFGGQEVTLDLTSDGGELYELNKN